MDTILLLQLFLHKLLLIILLWGPKYIIIIINIVIRLKDIGGIGGRFIIHTGFYAL